MGAMIEQVVEQAITKYGSVSDVIQQKVLHDRIHSHNKPKQ